jgi:hypothetical protein
METPTTFKSEYDLHKFQVKGPNVPTDLHYQILVFETSSVYIEGDERSRTNPGHGYPAHTETHESFRLYCFTKEWEWKAGLTALYLKDQHRKDVLAQVVERVAQPRFTVDID